MRSLEKSFTSNIEMINNFLKDNELRLSSETIRSYRLSLTQFFTFQTKEYASIKSSDIRLWLIHLENQSLKPRSIRIKLAAIKSFYMYVMEEEYVKKDPTLMISPPKLDDSLPRYLTKKQLVMLQELTKPNIRDRAIVEVL